MPEAGLDQKKGMTVKEGEESRTNTRRRLHQSLLVLSLRGRRTSLFRGSRGRYMAELFLMFSTIRSYVHLLDPSLIWEEVCHLRTPLTAIVLVFFVRTRLFSVIISCY